MEPKIQWKPNGESSWKATWRDWELFAWKDESGQWLWHVSAGMPTTNGCVETQSREFINDYASDGAIAREQCEAAFLWIWKSMQP